MPYLMIFNEMLTNDIISFEQLGPGYLQKHFLWIVIRISLLTILMSIFVEEYECEKNIYTLMK